MEVVSTKVETSFGDDNASKLRGETRYIEDIHRPGELHGGILRSPFPYARIRHIDVTRARTIDGVRVVLTGADVSQTPYGPTPTKDWNILAQDTVLMVGDEVAAVAATTPKVLQAALQAIDVEYEPLSPLLDPEQALRETAPQLHPDIPHNRPLQVQVTHGNVEDAFARAAHVAGGRFTTNRIYQGYLEPNAVIAEWSGAGDLTLWAPSHIPTRARETYAAALQVPEAAVRIIVPPIGGSFGGKYVLKSHVIAAVLAWHAGAPVRMVLGRDEDMVTAHPRVPLTIDLRIAVDREGHFLGKDVVVYADAGARVYWSPNVLVTACTRVDSLYHFHNVRAEGHLCYTNQSPTTCMRGFGNAEMLFAVESVIDELANELGMDPAELRLKNAVHRNEVSIHGYQLASCELETCIRSAIRISGWERRSQLPRYHGLGMAVANHVSGYRAIDPRYEGSNAVARLGLTGEIEIETGEIDLGQGLSAAYARMAGQVLGIDPAHIVIRSGDTAQMPYGIGTLASRGTVIGGNAVVMAATELREALAAFARQAYGASAVLCGTQVTTGGGASHSLRDLAHAFDTRNPGQTLTVRASYRPETDLPDAHFYGNPSPSYPFAAHVAEVEVDPLTGRTRVVGYWAVHDSGTIIDPVSARSQVAGAVAQGLGWALFEDLVVADGYVQNPNMMDYRLPGAGDIPEVEVDFVEASDPHGPLGAKSLAEVAIDPVPAAIANAIAHATGVRNHDLPLSAEHVWRAMH